MKKTALYLLVCVLSALLAGCLAQPVVTPPEPDTRQAQNMRYEEAIRRVGLAGDWLVIRGYHAGDLVVANATDIPLSHVGIYDPERNQVIEAEGKGVHASPLSEFVDKSHRLILIRPKWSSEQNRTGAIEQARAMTGRQYDFLGTLGLNSESRYYCTELAVDIYRNWHGPSEHFPSVIKPGELYLWGTILYDSQPRD